MPGKPNSAAANLFDDGNLLGFLNAALEQMEAAAGGTLGEERAKLMELQAVLGGLGAGPTRPTPTAAAAAADPELHLAAQLDELEQQLNSVAQQIATADNSTKTLLTQSAVVWAGGASTSASGRATAGSSGAVSSGDSGSGGPSAAGRTPGVQGEGQNASTAGVAAEPVAVAVASGSGSANASAAADDPVGAMLASGLLSTVVEQAGDEAVEAVGEGKQGQETGSGSGALGGVGSSGSA
ncbi:hypothetical protein HYH02_004932 [Chlamydomonas schloesseri]|uniref:Uncharacterized protein n=1 Tax=Chlamydomonas schloesseri TaxID=2026947 RepID=A0A835WMX0_9CHLO|nr:hypothetical protein HYH02_004932 [Chlamydomonas schloesseri]|eukprot:KAG2450430.1 hypothetical protein HYH02_004932 [Chlamydomonas schloesseri]